MVLPEELVNYVKDQLSQDAPVANIISDVKSKGYQISSSTIYKIRASILPKRAEIHKQSVFLPENNNENSSQSVPQQTHASDQGLIPGGINIASIDIQELKILFKVYKNEQELMSKCYNFENTQEQLDRVMEEINSMCKSILINHVMITSLYLNQETNIITLPDQTQYKIESFGSSPPIHTRNYFQLIGSRYASLFQKDIILLVFDQTLLFQKYDHKTLQFTKLNLQHLQIVRHPDDKRILQKSCQYHDNCLTNYLNSDFVSDTDDYVCNYIAQVLYTLVMCHPDTYYVVSGYTLQKFNQTKVLARIKFQLQQLINNAVSILPDQIVHQSQQDAAVLGGICVLQKQIKPDGFMPINPLTQPTNLMQPYVASPGLKFYRQLNNGSVGVSDRVTNIFSRIPTACEGFQQINQTPLELEMLANVASSAQNDTKFNG